MAKNSLVQLKITADASEAVNALNQFRKEFDLAKGAIESKIAAVDAFETLKKSTKEAFAEFKKAEKHADDLGRAIMEAARNGKEPTAQLRYELEQAKKALVDTRAAFDTQAAAVKVYRSELSAAGIDVKNLASEQQRLRAEQESSERAAGMQKASDRLGVTRLRQLKQEMTLLETGYKQLSKSGTLSAKERAVAEVQYKNKLSETRKEIDSLMGTQERRAITVGRAMAGALAGLVSISAVKQIGKINSEWIDLSGRLRRVTADEEEFKLVTEQLGEVAEKTWTGLNETVESYLSMQGPLADMGYTAKEQLAFVAALNDALVVSGAKKEVAASVQNALNNAMALGVLRGQDLNTVIAKGGRVAQALADKLKRPVSELKRLGAEGRITSEVIYEALAGIGDVLREESEAMAATFDDAMGRVKESIHGALRDEDLMKPLTESMLALAETLKDPSVRDGLVALVQALTDAAAGGVTALSELGDGAASVGHHFQSANKWASELEDLEHQIKQINRSLTGSGMSSTLGGLVFSKAQLRKWRDELQQSVEMIKDGRYAIAKINKEIAFLRDEASKPLMFRMSGRHKESLERELELKEMERGALIARHEAQKKAAEASLQIDKEAQEKQQAALRKHVADMKTERDQLVAGVKKAAKDIENAEKDSLKKIENLRKERLGIEERYRKAIAKLTGAAGPVEATYGNAQMLKVKARDALAKGDLKEAQEYAAAALEILEKIKEEGGNTYGFEGFAKELQAIELAAKDQEIKKEEEKRKKILYELTKLKELADEVKNIDIRVDLDEESLANARSKLDQLAKGVDITPSVGGAGAAGASSTAGAAGAANSTASVKVDADIEPAKKTVDRWQIGVSSQSLVVPVDADTGKIRDDLYRAGNSFSDKPIEMPVKLKDGMIREGLWKAGNEFADHPITVAASFDEENLKRGIRRIAGSNEFTNVPVEVPVEAVVSDDAGKETQQAVEQALGDTEVSTNLELDQSSVAQVGSEISSAVEQLAATAVVPVTLQMQGGGTDQLPGYATGGHIRGPGTSTSDSILARLSNGEFVMRAAAVRKYGLDMLHRMNNMQIPQFATGGLVEQVANIEPRQPQSVGTLNFNLPGGESFSVNTAGDFSEDLRRAALKYGKPRR